MAMLMAEVMTLGLTPRSMRRGKVPAALLVWSVEKTKVAGQSGVDGDFGGFFVADFADHYDVRVLARALAQSFQKMYNLFLLPT